MRVEKYNINKKNLCVVLLTVALLLFIAVISGGCSTVKSAFEDKSYIDDDYVEVTGLRAVSTNIEMSSTGAPSTYRLKVSVVPENATNQKLKYYISSEYHKYVTVDADGLLSAHAVSNDISVPVIVTSTTNPNAKITFNVKIEDVSVESIAFVQDSLDLWYNGNSAKVDVKYFPSHAIDGRGVTYSAINPEIASVSQDGTVTPLKAGNTTIKAHSETRTGKIIDAFMSVKVSYADGEYQLDVSGKANYNQVINNYTAIDFTLLILGEHVDPNPRIEWFVDTERVPTNSNLTQYSHVPTATTPMTYRIKVVITPYGKDSVEIYSKDINIHKGFNGVTLNYLNLSSVYESHIYGDIYTFELKSGDSSSQIAKYKWYLAEQSDPNHSVLIAETTPQNKNLTRRINVAGDYILTAHAVDENGNTISQSSPFTFSAERFVEGDTLIAEPQVLEYGLPPDSYHWYVVECDENGNYNEANKKFYMDTAAGDTLYYPLKKGVFRFIVTATIDGVSAKITENGTEKNYSFVSAPIRVYDDKSITPIPGYDLVDTSDNSLSKFKTDDFSAVEEIKIEGIYYNNDYSVFVRWNNTSETYSHIVEVKKTDGTVLIIDGKNSGDIIFGSNYCYIPKEILSLDDKFSVRVKTKNGLFSAPVYYGTPNDNGVADATHVLTYHHNVYEYFNAISYNNTVINYTATDPMMKKPLLNQYVYDMEDLREMTDFILLYRPSANSVIARTVSESNFVYTVKLFIPFEYTDELAVLYPYDDKDEKSAAYGELSSIYLMIKAAAASSVYPYEFDLDISGANNVYTISFITTPDNNNLKFSQPTAKPTQANSLYFTETPDYASVFPIDDRDTVYVYTSDELVLAIQNGFCPVPTSNENLTALYKKIKSIVAAITHDLMSDREKLLAFYDYLTLNMVYDVNLQSETKNMTLSQKYAYESYHLEGAFNSKTVVDEGMAKALVVLCGIVNIPCVAVCANVKDNGDIRAWNKVYIDGAWYVVDAMRAVRTITAYNPLLKENETYSATDYTYFMLSDAEYSVRIESEFTETNKVPSAVVSRKEKEEIHSVSTVEELIALFDSVDKIGVFALNVKFDKINFPTRKSITNALSGITSDNYIVYEYITSIHSDEDYITAIVSLTVLTK